MLKRSTDKLGDLTKSNTKKPNLNLETFIKNGSDVLKHQIFVYLELEDIVKLSLTSKTIANFLAVNKPIVIRTSQSIRDFDVIKNWISNSLKSLKCKNLSVSNDDLKCLPTSLEELELGLDQKVTNEGIRYLPRKLKMLKLLYGIHISNAGLLHLPPNLTHLSLNYNLNITDSGIKLLPRSLIYLNLASNLNITDIGLKLLPPKLEFLNLHANMEITNQGLKNLPPTIKSLDLHSNKLITDEGLPYLSKSISYLDLHSTRLITEEGIKSLPIERMNYLDLFFNKKIPRHTLNLKSIPSMKHLSFCCIRFI